MFQNPDKIKLNPNIHVLGKTSTKQILIKVTLVGEIKYNEPETIFVLSYTNFQ